MSTVRRRVLAVVGSWLVLGAGLRVSFLAPEDCGVPDPDDVRAAALASADWIVANQAPDGSYLYDYDRVADEVLPGYNLVRHAGTTMSLMQLVVAGEDAYLPAADRGVQWMLDRTLDTGAGGLAFAAPSADAKLGAVALLGVSLAHRRLATGDTRYDETMVALGVFMVGQQRADGSMLNFWDRDTSAPLPDQTSLYSTGEALWALAMFEEALPGNGFADAVDLTLDYVVTDRDEDEDVWPPPWPDQWASYSLNEVKEWGLEDRDIDYARRVAGQYGAMVRWEAQQTGGIQNLTHGPEASAAGQGTWLEGLAMLLQVAEYDPRLADVSDAMYDRLICSASRLMDKQVSGTGDPLLDGAFFTDDRTRVDHQQHALSGLLFTEELLRRRDTTAGGANP